MIESKTVFGFGKNWAAFTESLTEANVDAATRSLAVLVGDLRGKTFLDAGCGSGIHSLAATRLGASRVHSFDYDPDSVACSQRMKDVWAPGSNWTIESGSCLDADYLASLGQFDVVYSWGVLHHTGDLWRAMDLVRIPMRERLVISIYNDQGLPSRFWTSVKRKYNTSGTLGRKLVTLYVFLWFWGVRKFLVNPFLVIKRWRGYSLRRGMSPWHDVVDWAGGYPFEVARPEEVISFFESRSMTLSKIIRCRRRASGCNEFVFLRDELAAQRDALPLACSLPFRGYRA